MPILRLPKTIRWLLICSILLLVLLTLYRLGISVLFKPVFQPGRTSIFKIFWTGFRFDGRIVGGFTLILLFISFFPDMHLFKTTMGKNTAFSLYSLFFAGLLFFYLADFVYIYTFDARLQGSLISDLAKNTDKGILFKHNSPWVAMVLGVAVVSWLFFLLIRRIHSRISKRSSGSDHKLVRIYWQVLSVLLCFFGLFGRVGKWPLTAVVVEKSMPKATVQLTITPIESFITSLPQKSGTLKPEEIKE